MQQRNLLAPLHGDLAGRAGDSRAAVVADVAYRLRELGTGHEFGVPAIHITVRHESFRVLARNHQVHALHVCRYAGARSCRPHIGEQVELFADDARWIGVDLVLRRIAVGIVRPHHDAIDSPGSFQHALVQCMTVLLDTGVSDRVMLEVQAKFKAIRYRLQDLERGRGDFRPDAVAGKHQEFHGGRF